MTDSPPPTTSVWIDDSPSPDAERALFEWARARGLELAKASGASSRPEVVADQEDANRVEADLTLASQALVQEDTDAAERALARAEARVIGHPELPQAAWLRAEVERGWSARFSHLSPKNEERARAAWQRADALAGPRVPALTETATVEEWPLAHVRFVLPDGELWVDARRVTQETGMLAEGPHQVRVVRDGRTVRAAWVGVGEGTVIDFSQERSSGACSKADFATVALDPEGAPKTQGVTCPTWVLARSSPVTGTITVASCERDHCSTWLEWRTLNALPTPEPFVFHKRWPVWATWTLVGVGAATATAVTVIATGVLEAHAREPRFTNGGVKVESRP